MLYYIIENKIQSSDVDMTIETTVEETSTFSDSEIAYLSEHAEFELFKKMTSIEYAEMRGETPTLEEYQSALDSADLMLESIDLLISRPVDDADCIEEGFMDFIKDMKEEKKSDFKRHAANTEKLCNSFCSKMLDCIDSSSNDRAWEVDYDELKDIIDNLLTNYKLAITIVKGYNLDLLLVKHSRRVRKDVKALIKNIRSDIKKAKQNKEEDTEKIKEIICTANIIKRRLKKLQKQNNRLVKTVTERYTNLVKSCVSINDLVTNVTSSNN